MNVGGFSDSVFNVISAFLADNNQRFVAEVEAIELETRIRLFSKCGMLKTQHPQVEFPARGYSIDPR
jgi:hypothetical protein